MLELISRRLSTLRFHVTIYSKSKYLPYIESSYFSFISPLLPLYGVAYYRLKHSVLCFLSFRFMVDGELQV